MKEKVKVTISKEAYEKIQHVNFSDVVVSLKALRCELNLDDKTEKDHCAIFDIELPQKENQMNIDKLETQTEGQITDDLWYDAHQHCDYHKLGDDVVIEFEHEDSNFVEKITVARAKEITKNPMRHTKRWRLIVKEVEWSNGDECLYMNSSEVHKFIGIDPTRSDFCYIKANCSAVNWVEIAKLSKPETPEAKEKRERLEAAYDLYCEWCNVAHIDFADWKNEPDYYEKWLRVVDKTNYRKGVK